MAKLINVSPSTYREWEYGRQIIGEPYQALAEVFGVTLSELMTGHKNQASIMLDDLERTIRQLRKLL